MKAKIGQFTEEQLLSLARNVYREGTASFKIIPDSCALIVIDMQDDFVKPGWTPFWVPEATRQVHKIKGLIEHCRKVNVPVIYTVFSKTHRYLDRPSSLLSMPIRYAELDIDQSEFFVQGSVWKELKPKQNEIVIHKSSYGAFYDTPLETILKNLHKDTVIICGTLTNFCCSTTARQAYERGFKVIFGSDITATDVPELQEHELMTLRKGFARVLSAQDIIRSL